ncbi:MAG: hypothetical protein GXO32_01775 [Crenarchaeota archaeon]|nr:hypothetical protein [Thermoproteota archaeon]
MIRDPLRQLREELRRSLEILAPEYRDVIEWIRKCGLSFVYSDTDSLMISVRCADKSSKEELVKATSRFVELVNTLVQAIYGETFRMDLDDDLTKKLARGEPPLYNLIIVAKAKGARKPAAKSYLILDGDEIILKGKLYKERAVEAVEEVREELIKRAVRERWGRRRLEEEIASIISRAPTRKLFFARALSLDMRREKGGGGFKQISKMEHYVRFVRAAQLFSKSEHVAKYVKVIRRGRCRESLGEICGTVMIDASIYIEVPAVDARYLPVSGKAKRCRFWILKEIESEYGGAKVYDCACSDPAFREGFYVFNATCLLRQVERPEIEATALAACRGFIDMLWSSILSTLHQGEWSWKKRSDGDSE